MVNIANGRTAKVTITDRGPFAEGRVIDLSKKAAKKLGMISTGVAPVEIKYKKKK
ncbi:RlpA-like protein precursor [compost metagenome]